MYIFMDIFMDIGLFLYVLCVNFILLEKCVFMIIIDLYCKYIILSVMFLVWFIVCF